MGILTKTSTEKMLEHFEVKTTDKLKASPKFMQFVKKACGKEECLGYKISPKGVYIITEKSFKSFDFDNGKMSIISDGVFYKL